MIEKNHFHLLSAGPRSSSDLTEASTSEVTLDGNKAREVATSGRGWESPPSNITLTLNTAQVLPEVAGFATIITRLALGQKSLTRKPTYGCRKTDRVKDADQEI